MSRSLLTSRTMSCCPIASAAACTSLRSASVLGVSGFTSMAIVVALGTSWRSSSSRFAPNTPLKKTHARDVAARPVEAGDEAVPDRVAPGREDDRHRRGCGLGRERRNGVPDDHGHRPANQIGHQSRQPIKLIFRRAIFDRDVLALDEACFLQALAERGHEVRRVGERRAAEKSDHRHRRLLRARRERPRGRRAAEKRDELAPPHSITSSARASSVVDSRPSAFAVLRLMTSSNFGRLHHRQIGGLFAL